MSGIAKPGAPASAGESGRSAAPRRAHPAAASLALAALALAALALAIAREASLGPLYVVKVLAAFAAVAIAVLATLPEHHPFPRFGPANQATLARGAFTALLAGLIGEGGTPAIAELAFALAAIAATLDAIDGQIARATGMSSEFGARFDMETDAALLLVLSVLAWQLGKAGPWVIALGLARYVFVAAGAGFAWLRRPLPPSFRRKAVCAVQMAALFVVLAPPLAPPVTSAIAALALALLLASFAADVAWLRRNSGKHLP